MQQETTWLHIEDLFKAQDKLAAVKKKRRQLRMKLRLLRFALGASLLATVGIGSYWYIVWLF